MPPFNPITYAKRLKAVGVPEAQAELNVTSKLNWLMTLIAFLGTVLTILNFIHLFH